MRRLKKIFQSTIAKVISAILLLAFGLSLFFYFDFYKYQINKARAFWAIYQGDKAYDKQDLQSAINFYEYGIKLYPKHYIAMYNLANIYVVYEDYYQALKNYEKALEVCPEYEVARINYAIILSETYKTDEAIEQYKKVIENKPKFLKIPFLTDNKKSYNHNLGVAYYNMGIAYRTKSLLAGLNPQKKAKYLYNASESYKKAQEILKNYNTNYNLALIHQLLKHSNQAGYYYCKAIEASPLEYEAHFNLGVLLNDLKDYNGAAEEFKKAGLILDVKADNVKTSYIYDILAEVNQKISLTKEENNIKEVMTDNSQNAKKKKDAQEEMIEDFKMCAGYEIFVGEKK